MIRAIFSVRLLNKSHQSSIKTQKSRTLQTTFKGGYMQTYQYILKINAYFLKTIVYLVNY